MECERKNTAISLEERKIIEKMVKLGISGQKIAQFLDRSSTGINTELRINGGANYSAEKAHQRSEEAKKKRGNWKKKDEDEDEGLEEIESRIDSLQMQIDILKETIQEILNK